MSRKTVSINLKPDGTGKILIDGDPVEHVRRVRVEAGAGETPVVHLELCGVLVQGEFSNAVMIDTTSLASKGWRSFARLTFRGLWSLIKAALKIKFNKLHNLIRE